jgi:uncharacterized protein (DUF2126 family)/transglutaminase-like putative cysteine protease
VSVEVALLHRTEYRYGRPIELGPQTVRLRPAAHTRTPVLAYSLQVEPSPHFLNWQQDPQGNYVARLVFPEKTQRFAVTVDLIVDMAVINPFDFFLDADAEQYPFAYDETLESELAPFRSVGATSPLLERFLQRVNRSRRRTIDFLVDINRELQRQIRYVIRLESGVQTPEKTLERAEGSCRDSAWLLVQILRRLGLAARFASGYLIQLVPDQKPLEGPPGPSSDFTDLHAWCEVYLPGAGWIGLDPTSGLLAGEGHIPLACSPEPLSAAPISGLIEPCKSELRHEMSVRRVKESPRVTRPYAEEDWSRLVALGARVDRDLEMGDVRLTLGGEPTFVAAGDPDGAEWNTDALGPTKRAYAGRLLRRLADRFASGYLLYYGQGKWYPGEQLPRWALSCHWRKDGEAIWHDKELFAADESPNPALGSEGACRFITRLAERLRLDPSFCLPGYEDSWYYLWKERRLPANVDPFQSELKDPLERARLARVFEEGLSHKVGFTLPLRRTGDGEDRAWQTGPWFLRSERMYLLPGDSPMGYRLPLDSLPWVTESDFPYIHPQDPMAPREAFPARQRFRSQNVREDRAAPPFNLQDGQELGWREQIPWIPQRGQPDSSVVRTALCVEVRGGLLHVFMPPVETAEDYLDLAAAVEDVAAQLAQPVVIEGYPPPTDPRLLHFSVTPDPGVIEVNVHPAASWNELISNTYGVYEEARAVGLAAEKFMLDGSHVGTGGGNHLVVGGVTPADSPLLRRPDLLKSLVGYWHNHPSLSYLFSGLFIGPTSQHPRVDEGRDDATYELEIAFQTLAAAESFPPWLADRALRDVLVDVTGNTHRAEFSIDKLYCPDSASNRHGLLELRAFEMPPHPRMSLAQQLLLRGLIAMMWWKPYRTALARYGTRLHDDFMLPYFVANDFEDVLGDLQRTGYPFESSWFDAHREFRFPSIGKVAYRGIEIELRHALEPWHVTGEDAAGGTTVRFVDSSLERLQVKIDGATGGRHQLVVNGCVVPLRATGRQGEFVAGVRYRAWQPPRALHPTIPVDTPLVFDLLDTWNNRSMGGCTYHAVHPGGQNYTRFPVNSNEAETRRRARFFPFGHTPGTQFPVTEVPGGEHPLTLDLRRIRHTRP